MAAIKFVSGLLRHFPSGRSLAKHFDLGNQGTRNMPRLIALTVTHTVSMTIFGCESLAD